MNKLILAGALALMLGACGEKNETGGMPAAKGPLTDEQKKEWAAKFANPGPVEAKAIEGEWQELAAKYVTPIKENEEVVNSLVEGFSENSYEFKADGTFICHATIDSDGKWSLGEGNMLKIENNLRRDVEDHKVIIQGNNMIWMFDAGDGMVMYQFFEKK